MLYMDWQIRSAGGQTEIFSPAAKRGISRCSQGVPRMINRLALECLNEGCVEGAKVITEELFAHVCKNLGPHLTN